MLAVPASIAPAEASCDSSHVQVLTQASIFDRAVPLSWSVDAACNAIETGASIHDASGQLLTSAAPVHGARAVYSDRVTVPETGLYWLTAYAIEEDGSVAHAAPRAVLVVIPSLPEADPDDSAHPRSSTLASTSAVAYTGTDADFLQPMGNVHMAAIKSEQFVDEGVSHSSQGATFVVVRVAGGVGAASTDRADVTAQVGSTFTVDGETFVWDAASIQAGLDQDAEFFQRFAFPRPGVYAAACSGTSSTLFIDGAPFQSIEKTRVCGGATLGLRMRFRDASSHSATAVTWQRSQSTMTYFIPAAPTGTKLRDAKLRMNVQGSGAFVQTKDFSVLTLNGKAPEAVVPIFCSPFDCILLATWDFTDETRMLVGRGGGLFPLAVDAIPPLVSQFPGQTISTAYWVFQPNLNYPWRHGGTQDALTLTFTQACPHDLTVAVTPSTVRPRLPANTRLTGELATMATRAAVEATVRACPPDGTSSPASVVIQFAVDQTLPQPGTPDAGGHSHDTRPARARGTFEPSSCTALLDPDGVGTCMVTYLPSEVSSVETLIASAAGFPTAEARVSVQVPGLTNLADIITNFFRLTGQTPAHRDNHWGSRNTTDTIQNVALDFFALANATLGINDLSLKTGGLFDIAANWTTPHISHRTGTSVDIDRTACIDPALEGGCARGTVRVPRDRVERLCDERGSGVLVREVTFHCEFPR